VAFLEGLLAEEKPNWIFFGLLLTKFISLIEAIPEFTMLFKIKTFQFKGIYYLIEINSLLNPKSKGIITRNIIIFLKQRRIQLF
jgi:hypothetical protein